MTRNRPPSQPRDAFPGAFERRAARAELLAAGSEAARAPLLFAAGLYRAQGALARAIDGCPLSGSLAEDMEGFSGELPALLRFAARAAPAELAQAAKARAGEDRALLCSRLLAFWAGESDGGADYLSRALLRPYLEVLAARHVQPDRARRPGRCPFCGGPPWIASRRAAGGADGAGRALGCALCAVEWPVNRIHCAACAEQDPARLPSFQSDRHPAVRIEACEGCRRYLKSIDLTVDGRLIPEVDDLTSLAMDLWARDEGFTRVEPGLAGV